MFEDNRGASWSRSYGSWIYNYICNQCQSPQMLWIRIPLMTRCIRYNIICQLHAVGWWFTPVSCSNKIDRHKITEILLKVPLNTITLTHLNLEENKGIIRSRKSTNYRHYNGQKRKCNNDLQNTTQKTNNWANMLLYKNVFTISDIEHMNGWLFDRAMTCKLRRNIENEERTRV